MCGGLAGFQPLRPRPDSAYGELLKAPRPLGMGFAFPGNVQPVEDRGHLVHSYCPDSLLSSDITAVAQATHVILCVALVFRGVLEILKHSCASQIPEQAQALSDE